MFNFDTVNGYKVLRSDSLGVDEGVNAFFTTRNCPLPKGEDITITDKNNTEQILSLSPYFDKPYKIITAEQTHSDHIQSADERVEYKDTDAIIVTEPDVVVFLRYADCTPLIFYDEIKGIGAVVHAGWRGTAARIAVKTIAKMVLNFSTKPENVIALIGPAISGCCYEVSEDVSEKILSSVKNREGLYDGRKVDLKKVNARQLEEIGVEKIDICPYCTSCNNDLFYSYRRENGTTERHYAVLKLDNLLEQE